MKKLLLVFCVLLGLTGCGQVLDESFDKETLKQETIAIVENLNDENYDAIVTTVNDDLKDILSASVIQNGKLQVTATYNTDMELIGLYIK